MAKRSHWLTGLPAALVQSCYRRGLVRVMLFPCQIGMCVPSAGTALGIYLGRVWDYAGSLLLGH